MSDVLSDRLKSKFPAYKGLVREPQAAPPVVRNLWTTPNYKPERVHSVRPGADDHQQVKSRGFPT